jgi:membrane peptidoglycan carboxypeptidase
MLAGVLAGACVAELQTSWLQSKVLAATGRQLWYRVEAGQSGEIAAPKDGPYNVQFGYTRVPDYLKRLRVRGYEVTAQARISQYFHKLMSWGINAPYHEKDQAGLRITGARKAVLYSERYPSRTYGRFEEIPRVVVESLAYIENREILNTGNPYRNPSVEWDRLTLALVDVGLNRIYSGHAVSGGSTLATQLEKMRHSPGGVTAGAGEKARQMMSASVRAYLDGESTIEARRRILKDYLNWIPLSAIAGYGEVRGLGDGLWAWYGEDFYKANLTLRRKEASAEQGRMYRAALSLLLALRRPTFFLQDNQAALWERTDGYLRLMAGEGIISKELCEAALAARVEPRDRVPAVVKRYAADKAIDGVRNQLLGMLGMDSLYDLDRLDLSVETTLDGPATRMVSTTLESFHDPLMAARSGLMGHRLLNGVTGEVVYSVLLYERTATGNLLRVQADNYDQPLNINDGTRLELGSTAKLRTLVHYLEIIAGLHRQYQGWTAEQLRKEPVYWKDKLRRWSIDYLRYAADKSLKPMLEAAMERYYWAVPDEPFFTGGGIHRFSNFESKDDYAGMTLREAFYRSVNLVFIRLMRDISWYHIMSLDGVTPATLDKDNDRVRRKYLERFADREGKQFLIKYYRDFKADISITAGKWSHPLAIWLDKYLKANPKAGLREVFEASRSERQTVYEWLFLARQKEARDKRVFIMLEEEAFGRILGSWKRVGYPFETITPSLATAIGSSGDNPAALAELAGILVNDGKRWPRSRIERLHFAQGTPMETVLERKRAAAEQVLPKEVAEVIREAMVGVVEKGTAVRAAGGLLLPDGTRMPVGGKTGTGDNRRETYGRGGVVLHSRPMNRTATFVFFVGDRYFGVVTAFVNGEEAGGFSFTSSLPVQVFKSLSPVFARVGDRDVVLSASARSLAE